VGGSLRTVWRFAGHTFGPLDHPVANGLLFLVGFIGLPLGLSRATDGWIAGLAVVALFAILLFVAGVRRQWELDRRNEVRFDIDDTLVDTSTAGLVVRFDGDPHAWKVEGVLLVTVANEGPTARFAARITDVQPASLLMGRDLRTYGVAEVAWEDTIEPFKEIASGFSSRLKVATAAEWNLAATTGPGWWFHTAKSASYSPNSHGNGSRLKAPLRGVVSMTLTVVNVDAGQQRTQRLQVEFIGGVPRTFEKL